MNLLDLFVLVSLASAALGGYRLGFLARVASWLGLTFGLFVAARMLPSVVDAFEGPDPSSRLIVAIVVLVGGSFLGQGIGLLIGAHVGRFLPVGPLRMVDKAVGAAVGSLGVLVALWLLLPAMSDVQGWPSEQARGSVLAKAVDDVAPPAPDSLQALRRLIGETNFPKVFDSLRPAPDAGPPPASSGLTPNIEQAVIASTVKVEGAACGRIQEGSGFAAATDTIVTNAHVVAGVKSRDLRVIRGGDQKRLNARVVVFDADRDLAVLQVRGLGQQPLAITDAKEGDQGAVFGHPGGQDAIRVAPARITDNIRAVGRDLYDTHKTERDVFVLAADLRPGDSGGALTNNNGVVVGVAFAIAPDRPGTSYALTTRELNTVLARPRNNEAPTGSCLGG